MSPLSSLLENPTRILFFTGKGGMGKTTLACSTAVALVAAGRRVLLVSTDPASNLDEVLGTELAEQPRSVPGLAGLDAANIDPEAAARDYRERIVGPYRGLLPDSALSSMEETLSGACTVEIAAFDAFVGLLGNPEGTAGYDHVIFDTAPTGHTLRLLSLPAAWTGFIDTNTTGVSCLGPLAGLQEQRDLYAASVRALGDPEMTTLVLVSRPEQTALTEAERTRGELAGAGMRRQVLALNGVFEANGSSDHDVCQRGLIAVFGVHQSLFAYHMKKLIAVGLVRVERRRKWAYYSVCTDAVQELSAFTAAEGSLRAPTCARPHGVTMPPGGIATKEG